MIMPLCINNNKIILFYFIVLPKLYYKINLTLFEILLSKHIYNTPKKFDKMFRSLKKRMCKLYLYEFGKYVECQSIMSNKVTFKTSWIHHFLFKYS